MEYEAESIRIELQVRGQPRVQGKLLEFVRTKTKRSKKLNKLHQIEVNGQSYYKSYSKSY